MNYESQQQPVAPDSTPGSKRWRRLAAWWPAGVAAIAALIVGVGIGFTAGRVDPTTTAEYGALVEERDDLKDLVGERTSELSQERSSSAKLSSQVAEFEERQKELDAKQEALDAKSTEVAEREKAVGSAEEQKAKNTISGDGVYVVGDDIRPGRWRTTGGNSCYWARLSGLSGDFNELLANGLPGGQAVVEIRKSDAAFETSGCGEWEKVG